MCDQKVTFSLKCLQKVVACASSRSPCILYIETFKTVCFISHWQQRVSLHIPLCPRHLPVTQWSGRSTQLMKPISLVVALCLPYIQLLIYHPQQKQRQSRLLQTTTQSTWQQVITTALACHETQVRCQHNSYQ